MDTQTLRYCQCIISLLPRLVICFRLQRLHPLNLRFWDAIEPSQKVLDLCDRDRVNGSLVLETFNLVNMACYLVIVRILLTSTSFVSGII